MTFQIGTELVTVHPSLGASPEGDWDDGPPRAVGWTDLASPDLNIDRISDHVVSIELLAEGASEVGVRFSRDPDERFWGFGVRSDAAERTTGVVENWVGEGPYQLAEYSLIGAIVPRWALRQRRDAAYFPIPWLMSSHGLGVLIDNAELSRFRLAEDLSIEVMCDRLTLHLFKGSGPAELLDRFTTACGRQPIPAAPWFLGPWVQTGHADLVPIEDEERIIKTLRSADAPVSAVETHMRRLPGGAHEGHRDDERRRTAMFHEYGLASLTYLNPFVSEDFARRIDQALPFMQRHRDGFPYLYDAYIGGREPPVTREGQLDFTNPKAADFFQELAAEAIEDGHDGWMEDFGEYTPPDAVCADGSTGATAHNRYPLLFHSAGARVAEAVAANRPIARFVRSGWTGVAPHAPLVWGGDPTTGWGFDGLASAVTQGLSAGLSGIAFWGSDIGGFFTLGEQQLDPELLIRWIQFGALSPLMRAKAEGIVIPPRKRPQIWDPQILPHWRRWAKLHTQLSPYLVAAADEYGRTGMPLMRHMCLVDATIRRSDQYLLGNDLLVAPVLEPGARERTLDVPRGRWIDLWRSARYDDQTGGVVPIEANVVVGPASVTLPAPLEEIPILVREGAVLPLLPADVWSLYSSPAHLTPAPLSFAKS